MGFTYEYTYQDYEYYACLVHLLYIQLVTNSIHVVFLLQAASAIALCHSGDQLEC